MAKLENTVECVQAIAALMEEKGLTRFTYEKDGFRLEMEAAPSRLPAPVYMAPGSLDVHLTRSGPSARETMAAAEFPVNAAEKREAAGKIVKSPIVGTYYNAPSPEKPPFVAVGQKVKKGDVLMIIESMKVMNEVPSEFDGTVAEIMVANGSAVDFDQPLMRIE